MKCVIYGGSFDPLQSAHLEIIKILSEKYDWVYVVPTNVEGYKENPKMFSFKERCSRISDAIKGMKNVVVSYVEEYAPPGYQFVNTLKYYSHELIGDELYFALGSDSFATIKSWGDWEEIVKLAKFVVINRDGDYKLPEDIPYDFIDYHNNASSTKVRKAVEQQIKEYDNHKDPLRDVLRVDDFYEWADKEGIRRSIENYIRYMYNNEYSLDLKKLLTDKYGCTFLDQKS